MIVVGVAAQVVVAMAGARVPTLSPAGTSGPMHEAQVHPGAQSGGSEDGP